MTRFSGEEEQEQASDGQRQHPGIEAVAQGVIVLLKGGRMKDHDGESQQANRARHRGPAKSGNQNQVAANLQQLDGYSKRNPAGVDQRDEQRISRRPDESRPAVGRAPIPILSRAHKPKRIVFRRASVNVFRLHQPEPEKNEKPQPDREPAARISAGGRVC